MSEILLIDDKPKRPFYEPGWYKNLSGDEYHGSFGTSSTTLKKLIEKTPAHMHYDMHHPKDPSEALNLGSLAHTLILEPEKFRSEYIILPAGLKQPTASQMNAKKPSAKSLQQMAEWDQFMKEAEGKRVVSEDSFNRASEMAGNVLGHPIARVILQDIIVESSIYWWYRNSDESDDTKYKEMVKVRPDIIDRTHGILADLKTTTDGSYDGFSRSIRKFYYHMSAAMYLDGVNQSKELLEEVRHFVFTKFVFICVESEPPYLCSVYELSREFLELGDRLYRRSMKKLHESRQSEKPPGFPEEIRIIEPPSFANRLFIV